MSYDQDQGRVTNDPRTMDRDHRSGLVVWVAGAFLVGLCSLAYWVL